MKITFFFLFLGLTISSSSQTYILNQLDLNGEKDGKWIEYLNSKWKVIKDSSTAEYCRFIYFDHGTKIVCEKYIVENFKFESSVIEGEAKKPVLLDGLYKWFDSRGRLLSENMYYKGERVWIKTYLWESVNKRLTGENVRQYVDYTKKYMGQENTCFSKIYDKDGNVKTYYLRKGNHGWCFYEE